MLARLTNNAYAEPTEKDALTDLTIGHLFGDIWNRSGLAVEQRSLVTCAILAALGREGNLRNHLRIACNLGIPRETLAELMVHVAYYSGWPTGVNGLNILKQVLAEMDGAKK
jgi:4-carboxymuconolactone decarboxylase